jgi:hypothetical protein
MGTTGLRTEEDVVEGEEESSEAEGSTLAALAPPIAAAPATLLQGARPSSGIV